MVAKAVAVFVWEPGTGGHRCRVTVQKNPQRQKTK